MYIRTNALIWAVIIITDALLGKTGGQSDSAAYAIIAGLIGAGLASINSHSSCNRGWLQ